MYYLFYVIFDLTPNFGIITNSMEESIIKKYQNGSSIMTLCNEYRLGKLKIYEILSKHNIKIRKRGGQIKHNQTPQSPISYDNHILSCKICNKEFNDVLNKSGGVTNHLKKCNPDITIPSSFKRRMYLNDTGQHWHHQFFNLKKRTNQDVVRCLECDWVTNDTSNKSGSLTKHIEKHHDSITTYIEKYPESTYLFSTIKNKLDRTELFLIDENFVTCQICNEQFKTISNTHLQLHNMTTNDYKIKFGDDSLISKTTKNEFITNLNNVEHNTYYRSKSEIEIEDYLKSLGINVIVCDKKQLGGVELDLYLPDHKIAIEYNGLYWHSEKRGKNRNYHLDKTNKCLNKGIKLIHIFSDEWLAKKEIIKNRLLNLINLNEGRIYARKCVVVELTKNEKKLFLETNHLQGNDKSSIYLGLKYDNKIVAVMTFGNLRKVLGSNNVDNKTYELFRYCSLNVIGGFTKLLNYFIVNYKPNKIITYANKNWSPSNEYSFYSKVGFNYVGETKPNYSYTKKYDVREHRFNFRKDKLIKMGYDKTKSESQIMFELGYDRIWDTGNLKYEMIFLK